MTTSEDNVQGSSALASDETCGCGQPVGEAALPGPSELGGEVAPALEDNYQDTSHAWLVLLAAFCLHIISLGNVYCYSVFAQAITRSYNVSLSQADSLGSLQEASFFLSGLLFAPMRNCYEWRTIVAMGSLLSFTSTVLAAVIPNFIVLFVTFGFFSGLGLGLLYFTALSAGVNHFVQWRASAMSLITNGGPFGMFILVLLYSFLLLYNKTLEIAWMIMSFEFLLAIPLGILLKPLPSSSSPSPPPPSSSSSTSPISDGEQPPTAGEGVTAARTLKKLNPFDFSLFRNSSFLLLCAAISLFAYGNIIPLLYMKELAGMYGVEAEDGDLLLTLMGLMGFMAPMVFGWLGDRSERVRFIMCGVALLLDGVLSLGILLITTYPLMLTYCILFGAFMGIFISYLPAVIADVFGLEAFDRAVGQSYAIGCISYIIAPQVAEVICESYGSALPFIFAGVADLIGTVCYFLIACSRKSHKEGYEEF